MEQHFVEEPCQEGWHRPVLSLFAKVFTVFSCKLPKVTCSRKFAFAKHSAAMKAPVGLLSDRTVLRSKMEGPRPDKFTLTRLDFCGNLSQQFNIHKIPLPREAPKANSEERTIWDEKTMLAALQTIENPALHLAVHLSMILSLREGEILGLQPSDLDFDAAYGRGTILVNKTMQRANKDALDKLDPYQVYHTFPDRREGSKSSLILKKPKTKKSNRVLYMTKPLKEELQAWLEKLKPDEQSAPEKYSNCGQLFRLPDGLPIAPELLTKWYRLWRAEHPEFEQIVFHGLRHSSATYQLLQSDGDFKSVQGNTGHATASVLMDTYAHTQDKPRLELTEKIEANFYSQDLTPAAPQPRQNEKPAATKISGREILEAIRLMDADERRELMRALFA